MENNIQDEFKKAAKEILDKKEEKATADELKEDLSSVLQQIKERFRMPFFSSFIIAWLIHNWKIVIGLIWYKSNTIKDFGYSSYKELIQEVDICDGFWWPLIAALVFSILIAPFLRYVSSAINIYVATETSKRVKKTSSGGFVSVDNFLAHEELYAERSKLLEKKLSTYQDAELKKIQADNKVLELENQVNNFNKLIEDNNNELLDAKTELNEIKSQSLANQKEVLDSLNKFKEIVNCLSRDAIIRKLVTQ